MTPPSPRPTPRTLRPVTSWDKVRWATFSTCICVALVLVYLWVDARLEAMFLDSIGPW